MTARVYPHSLESERALLGKCIVDEEALAEVEKAKEVWLDAAKAEGKPIPPPRYRPIIYQAAT